MIWVILAALCVVVIVFDVAYGGDITLGGGVDSSDDENVLVNTELTGGAVNTGGNKTVALANGLGDVDIAQCLGSTQWSALVIAKQKLVLNQVCMAEFYLKQGRYDLAAQALCNQAGIIEEYSSEVACEIDHDFTPATIAPPENHGALEEHQEIEEQYTEELAQVQMQQMGFVAQLEELTAQLSAVQAQPISEAVQQELEPRYTEEDVAYVLGLYVDGEEEDE